MAKKPKRHSSQGTRGSRLPGEETRGQLWWPLGSCINLPSPPHLSLSACPSVSGGLTLGKVWLVGLSWALLSQGLVFCYRNEKEKTFRQQCHFVSGGSNFSKINLAGFLLHKCPCTWKQVFGCCLCSSCCFRMLLFVVCFCVLWMFFFPPCCGQRMNVYL